MKLPELSINPALRPRLSTGHPWVYRNHVAGEPDLPSGTWVRVRCGDWRAIGLWNAEGPIAIRIFSRSEIPDRRWLRARLQEAWALREPVRAQRTTAWRWLFGESDGVPGITLDLYGGFAVIATYAASLDVLIPPLVEILSAESNLSGILLRHRSTDEVEDLRDLEGKIERLWGE